MFTDISRKNEVIVDVRSDIANVIYTGLTGIESHNLAFKIYNSDGVIELSDIEKDIIIKAAEHFCKPAFIDSVHEQFKEKQK
jgi:hypothetical protein